MEPSRVKRTSSQLSASSSDGASRYNLEVEHEDHVPAAAAAATGDLVRKQSESEEAPLVDEVALLDGEESDEQPRRRLTRAEERRKWWKVYVQYFVFLWNSNTYEYASVGPHAIFSQPAYRENPGPLLTSRRFSLSRWPSPRVCLQPP
jgi:hypothetical protein